MRTYLAALASGLLLTGCTTASLEALRVAQPEGDPFQTILAAHYLSFAESEAEQYDWIDSKHFADKGLQTVYGRDVAPESVEDWDVPASTVPQLRQAHETLRTLLADTAHRNHQPELLAQAQFSYDCWLEQQEENWQVTDIKSCREGFFAAVDGLRNPGMGGVEQPVVEDVPGGSDRHESLEYTTSYIVFFKFDSATLTSQAERVIATVVDDLKQMDDPYEVVLHAHTDAAGEQEYNLKLSHRRGQAVKQALVKGGVPEDRITILAFGETDPRLPVKADKPVESNRRVEIFLNG